MLTGSLIYDGSYESNRSRGRERERNDTSSQISLGNGFFIGFTSNVGCSGTLYFVSWCNLCYDTTVGVGSISATV